MLEEINQSFEFNAGPGNLLIKTHYRDPNIDRWSKLTIHSVGQNSASVGDLTVPFEDCLL